jgi:two-component system sensor histidine kinase KdpD
MTGWSMSDTVVYGGHVNKYTLLPYIIVTLMVGFMTIIFWKVGYAFTLVNLALLYLLPVIVSSVRWGLAPSFYAAAIGVTAFDYFFVPPIHRFTVLDIRYVVSFGVYLAVAIFTAGLAARLRQRVRELSEREAITSALYTLSIQVAAGRDLDTVLGEIVRHASDTFGLPAAILLPDAAGHLTVRAEEGLQSHGDAPIPESRIVDWVYRHGRIAGYGTNQNRDSTFLYVPLKTESNVHGVMCIGQQQSPNVNVGTSRMRIVQALAGLAAVCIARIRFEEEAKIAHLSAESERLRTALLHSISHELRTPLATILGAVTGMTESGDILSPDDRRELLSTIREGALRMNRLVTNLLGMVRMESGMLQLNKRWCDVSDIVGVALRQIGDALQHRTVEVDIPDNLPAIAVDEILIEQVLVNLLSNAVKYSPDGSLIRLDFMEYDGIMTLCIRDEGMGIREDEAEKIFEKFYRSDTGISVPGTGLGLAICKGIVEAHGGEIFARPAEPQGTMITIRLPVGD